MHLSNEVQRICTGSCKHLGATWIGFVRFTFSDICFHPSFTVLPGKGNTPGTSSPKFQEEIYTLYIDHGDFSSQFSMEHFCQSNDCSFQVPAAFESLEMLIDLQYQWKGLRLRSSEAAVVLRKLIQMTLQLDNSYTILNPNSTQFVSSSLSSLPFFP